MPLIHIDEENLVTKPIITFFEIRIMDKIRKLHVMNHFCLTFYNLGMTNDMVLSSKTQMCLLTICRHEGLVRTVSKSPDYYYF